MKNIYLALKLIVNLFLFCFYSLVAIIFWDFLFGSFIVYVLEQEVTTQNDIAHYKIAIFVFILTAILTIVFRKYLYISLNNEKKEKEDENLEIYVNKEIKK